MIVPPPVIVTPFVPALIVPLPPSVPVLFTVTAPVPVAEPLLLLASNMPALMFVPPA